MREIHRDDDGPSSGANLIQPAIFAARTADDCRQAELAGEPIGPQEEFFIRGVDNRRLIATEACYQGFEGTAIYAEEARDPERTVPRATYLSMGFIGVFFVLTSWAFLASSDGATTAAANSPGTFAFDLSDEFVGSAWTTVMEILIITSIFAGMLAFQLLIYPATDATGDSVSRHLFAEGFFLTSGLMGRAVESYAPTPEQQFHPRFHLVAADVPALAPGEQARSSDGPSLPDFGGIDGSSLNDLIRPGQRRL